MPATSGLLTQVRKMFLIGLALLVSLFVTGCAVANRFYVPPALEEAEIEGVAAMQAPVPDTLTVTTWNVGYAGMGAESDFIYDLGEQRRPLSGALVDQNLAAITAELEDLESDVFLIQEAARPSWITYNRAVLMPITDALDGYEWSFGADVDTRGLPAPLRVQVGNATFSRFSLSGFERRGLPLEPTFELGVFRKGYRMHIARLGEGADQWVVVNIHLSTFDSEEDDVRGAQVAALLEFAQAEYALGHHVIIGGDWNLRLSDVAFPHTSDERFLFWVRDFQQDMRPEGWAWAIDPKTPTVRGAHQPYVPGENFTLIIDGFLVSPNVAVDNVETRDLSFQHTDHHPVTARFSKRLLSP